MKAEEKWQLLSEDQKQFITRKVAELGSVEAVEAFYRPYHKCQDQSLSIVDQYARFCIPPYWRSSQKGA